EAGRHWGEGVRLGGDGGAEEAHERCPAVSAGSIAPPAAHFHPPACLTCVNDAAPGARLSENESATINGSPPMRAQDVMTAEVMTVTPDTSIGDLAGLLVRHGISGVPVVDAENQLVGIVSEGDLLHRTELGTEHAQGRRRLRWL